MKAIQSDNKNMCASLSLSVCVCVFVWLASIQCAKIYMILWPDRNSKMWPSAAYKHAVMPARKLYTYIYMYALIAVYITGY